MKIAQFWMVMRLSASSDAVQHVDSLPHKKHATPQEASKEAQKLAAKYPGARGFVVLECIHGFAPVRTPVTELIEIT